MSFFILFDEMSLEWGHGTNQSVIESNSKIQMTFSQWRSGFSWQTLCENIFDFTTAGDWDCAAAVGLPALHYSVDFIFLSFGIMGFIMEL